MSHLKVLMEFAAKIPGYVSLYLCPALLLVVGFVLAVTHKKKAFPYVAVILGGVGLFLVSNTGNDSSVSIAWSGLYLVLCALVRLLFCFSFRTKKQASNLDEMYEKFHLDLDVPEEEAIVPEESSVSLEECGVRLSYVKSLLKKLTALNLSATDRLEADSISHTLEAYENRALSHSEFELVNDSLATVLKLTAKYKT